MKSVNTLWKMLQHDDKLNSLKKESENEVKERWILYF